MAETVWFQGVCDSLLARIETWEANYQKGEIYSTRHYLTERFEHEDTPVQYVHKVPFALNELSNLVRILTAEKPKWSTTNTFVKLYEIAKNPLARKKHEKMITTMPNGMFMMSLLLEWSELIELRDLLRKVKTGKVQEPAGIEGMLAAKKAEGKGMWE